MKEGAFEQPKQAPSLEAIKKARNNYEILGLSDAATAEEISKTFKDLAWTCHPNFPENRTAEKAEIYSRLNQAYNEIIKPEARDKYDRAHRLGKYRPASGGSESFWQRSRPASAAEKASEREDLFSRITKKCARYQTELEQDLLLNEEKITRLTEWYTFFLMNYQKPGYDMAQAEKELEAIMKKTERAGGRPEAEKRHSTFQERARYFGKLMIDQRDHLALLKMRPGFNAERIANMNKWVADVSEKYKEPDFDILAHEKEFARMVRADLDANLQFSTKQQAEAERPATGQKLRIRKSGGFVELVGNGLPLKTLYSEMEERGGYFIGKDQRNWETLINPLTGDDLSDKYKRIIFRDHLIIGEDAGGYQVLLDPTTGRPASRAFETIFVRNGKTYGKGVLNEHEINV